MTNKTSFNSNDLLEAKQNVKGLNVLFVNNTLSTGGAEKILLPQLNKLVKAGCNVDLFIVTGMGELVTQLPKKVNLLNNDFSKTSVLSNTGQKMLIKKVLKAELKKLNGFKLLGYQIKAALKMLKNKNIHFEKLVWQVLAKSAQRINKKYDIAVAYTEGASTYYVADYIKADYKIALVHTLYTKAGYTAQLDGKCYNSYNEILPVSTEVHKSFLEIHPECKDKTYTFEHKIDVDSIKKLAKQKMTKESPWNNKTDSIKILTVSRLVGLKAYDLLIDTAKILKKQGKNFVWVALGEGKDHSQIQAQIDNANLSKNFVLMGNVNNPYPYMKNCNVYVHASSYEGKSIAIMEARALGCAMVLSDIPGNQSQIVNKESGLFCKLEATDIANKINYIIDNPDFASKIKKNARASMK